MLSFFLSFFLVFFSFLFPPQEKLFLFFLKNKTNMLGFLTLGMVKGGSTRDAFTQKVALSGYPLPGWCQSGQRHLLESGGSQDPLQKGLR